MDRAVCRHAIWHYVICLPWLFVYSTFCQTAPTSNQGSGTTAGANRALPAQVSPSPSEQLPKRIFGIIPNYRSHASLRDSKPLTAREKFRLAARDSVDPGTFLLAGMYAGIAQASNATSSYGQGMAGYGRYYGSTYGDLMIGNFMTEAVYPWLFKQDPRYFRRGTGSTVLLPISAHTKKGARSSRGRRGPLAVWTRALNAAHLPLIAPAG